LLYLLVEVVEAVEIIVQPILDLEAEVEAVK
jgi:hypothetical protein